MGKIDYEKELKELQKNELKLASEGKELSTRDRLQKIRYELKMTQNEFAQHVGINEQTVKKYERVEFYKDSEDKENTKNSQIFIIKKIAENTTYSADYIIGVNRDNKDISKQLGIVSEYIGLNLPNIMFLHEYSTNPMYKLILNTLFSDILPKFIKFVKEYLEFTIIYEIIKDNKVANSVLNSAEYLKWKTMDEFNTLFNKMIEELKDKMPDELIKVNVKELQQENQYKQGKQLIEEITKKVELFHTYDNNEDEINKKIMNILIDTFRGQETITDAIWTMNNKIKDIEDNNANEDEDVQDDNVNKDEDVQNNETYKWLNDIIKKVENSN